MKKLIFDELLFDELYGEMTNYFLIYEIKTSCSVLNIIHLENALHN